MKFITAKEAAKKWGYSVVTVRKWCQEGKISITFRAEKINGQWQIPEEAECPKETKKGRNPLN